MAAEVGEELACEEWLVLKYVRGK